MLQNKYIYGRALGVLSGLLLTFHLFGIAFGFILGFVIDRLVAWEEEKGKAENVDRQNFSLAATSLLAVVAKADGQVTRGEVRAFRHLLRLNKGEEDVVGAVFNNARHQGLFAVESHLGAVLRATRHKTDLRGRLLDAMCAIASVDGLPSNDQLRVINLAAATWGVDVSLFAQAYGWQGKGAKKGNKKAKGQVGRKRKSVKSPLQNDALDGQDPYDVLGVLVTDKLADIKKAYRKNVMANHPDRLRAQGASKKKIEAAEAKMRVFNAAWDSIEKSGD